MARDPQGRFIIMVVGSVERRPIRIAWMTA